MCINSLTSVSSSSIHRQGLSASKRDLACVHIPETQYALCQSRFPLAGKNLDMNPLRDEPREIRS